jgi:hypothetical protein
LERPRRKSQISEIRGVEAIATSRTGVGARVCSSPRPYSAHAEPSWSNSTICRAISPASLDLIGIDSSPLSCGKIPARTGAGSFCALWPVVGRHACDGVSAKLPAALAWPGDLEHDCRHSVASQTNGRTESATALSRTSSRINGMEAAEYDNPAYTPIVMEDLYP